MDGVRVLSSLAVFIFLLLASFSAAREERSTRAAWTEQTTIIPYLAIVKHGSGASDVCSGSIPSISTVLTYCAKAAKGNNAYAGLLDVKDAKDPPEGDVQVRAVNSVVAYDTVQELKICKVDKWILNTHVGTVTINNEGSSQSYSGCQVVGLRKKNEVAGTTETVHAVKDQTISSTDVCSLGTTTSGILYTNLGAELALKGLDLGGPAVCGDFQRGISKEYNADKKCILYIDIAEYSPWIVKQINTTEEAGASGVTDANSTSPSSGYSIHSYLNKYSNWKVLGLLLFTTVIVL